MPDQTPSECPECGANVVIPDDVEPHEVVTCPDCHAELEVIQVSPSIVLKLAPPVEEDWGE